MRHSPRADGPLAPIAFELTKRYVGTPLVDGQIVEVDGAQLGAERTPPWLCMVLRRDRPLPEQSSSALSGTPIHRPSC